MREKTKREYVASDLQDRILKGLLKPGEKLRGVRQLAVDYKVSPQVIVDAFDMLETGMFIERRHGSGVYIRKMSEIGITNVGLIGFFEFGLSTPFFAKIAEMAMLPYLHEDYNFTIRSICSHSWSNFSREKEELNLMFRCMRLDCLLLHAPMITERCLKFAISQNVPVIFVGDFINGKFEGYDYNQLGSDSRQSGVEMLSQVVRKENCKEVTLYNSSIKVSFFKDFYEGIVMEAERRGIKLNILQFPYNMAKMTALKRKKLCEDILLSVDKSVFECPAINNGMDVNQFLETVPEILGFLPDFYMAKNTDHDKKLLFDCIYEEIKRVIDNPNDMRYVNMPLCKNIEKLSESSFLLRDM